MLHVAFLIVAIVLFVLAAIPWPNPPGWHTNLGWLGLAFFAAAGLPQTG